jgi:hypothetical protein
MPPQFQNNIPQNLPEDDHQGNVEMKKSKKWIWISVIIVVLLAVLVYIFALFQFSDSATPMAGWKTYTNTDLGFSFKYPNTWIIDFSKEYGILYVHDIKEEMSVGITFISSKETIENVINKIKKSLDVVKTSTNTISGVDWVFYTFSERGDNEYFFDAFASQNSITVQVGHKSGFDKIFNQILSTFKFTK